MTKSIRQRCCVLGGTEPYHFVGNIIKRELRMVKEEKRKSGSNLNSVHCRLLPRQIQKQNDLDKP